MSAIVVSRAMSKVATTFPREQEVERARANLDALGLRYELISPAPGYAAVGVPGLVLDDEARMALAAAGRDDFVCSGWVDHLPAQVAVPADPPPRFAEDVFGTARVMVLAPCVADLARIRITAHLSGDLTEVFPYLNTDMREGCYTARGPTFTFTERYRMICLYPRRITIAKADEIVDAWRVLEAVRRRVNKVWARRHEIAPSSEMRERPPALEIFKRLPRTNCKQCGEPTCLAFAARLRQRQTSVTRCTPVFGGDHGHLKAALLDICAGLGVLEPEDVAG
jgi:ArsR family metal-binding transcriptional regulator